MDGVVNKDETIVLETLADHILGFNPESISDAALHTAKAGIIDTIGVTLAGLPEACTQILLNTPGIANGPGPCLILGTTQRTSALDATLVNGTASHALDFDDFSDLLGGHQSVPLVPVLFALGEEYGLSGADIINAYVVGFEVEHRFAMAVHPHHYDKGWHPTATLGIFGTVAAAARALKLDHKKTSLALAIAASMASGIKANFGTMTKPLHVGHSGRAGLMAVLLAERGFEANPGAMEHHQGFLNVFNGSGNFDPAPLTDAWTDALAIELPTIGIKQFPCCGSTHQAIAAMLNLVQENNLKSNDVKAIEIATHPRRLRHTNTPHPTSVLQAKFSVQYAVARALLDGTVRLKDFEDGAYTHPDIEKLLAITSVAPFGEANAPDGQIWDAEVAVILNNDKRLVNRVNNMVGRSGDNAMSVSELRDKFSDCARRILTVDQCDQVFDQMSNLDALPRLGDLTANLSA